MENNAARAVRLEKGANYSKAMDALLSSGVHSMTQPVIQSLIDKHPQSPGPFDPSFHTPVYGVFPPLPATRHFKADEVYEAVAASCSTSAGGSTGLTFMHLKDMLSVDSLITKQSLAWHLAILTTFMAQEKMPPQIMRWFAGAPLTPLKKPDDGVRPIAVGETLRRLTAKLLLRRLGSEPANIMRPWQFGVSVPNGAIAIDHKVRHLMRKHGNNPNMTLLTIDFKNAFNLINRHTMLRACRTHTPSLFQFTQSCYNMSDASHLLCGETLLKSAEGTMQGDVLGPLLFALTLHDALTTLIREEMLKLSDDSALMFIWTMAI